MKTIGYSILLLLVVSCEQDRQVGKTGRLSAEKKDTLPFEAICDSLINTDYDRIGTQKVKTGQLFNIMGNLPLDSGKWTVMIYADGWTDSFLYAAFGLPERGVYLSDDIHLIREMAKDFNVKVRGDDCCTPDINLSFFQNGRMRLSLGVLLKDYYSDSLRGFQTELYGFTPFTKYIALKKYASRFVLCKKPKTND